jgi:hypothetical protein
VRYARAAAFGYPGAAASLSNEISDWLAGASHRESLADSPYSASERIANLAEVLFWIASPRAGEARKMIPGLKEQIERDAHNVLANVEYSLGVHNHLLNNARALYIASRVLPEHPSAQDWRRQGLELWTEYFPQLILEDGAFAEQSSHYHLLLSRTALEFWLACKESGWTLGADLEEKLRCMLRLANDLVRTDGSLPRFGDNSPDQTMWDLSGLLAAAHLHELLDEAPRHASITPLTVYYCDRLKALPQATPRPRRLYENGGYGFLRAGHIEVAAHADPRAETRAHGDSGRGSFEIWWRGRVIVREPGCFLSERNPKSSWYRSAYAQNVTCLDGLAPGFDSGSSRGLPEWYMSCGGTWRPIPENGLEFACDGFRRRRPDLCITRRWRVPESGSRVDFEEEIQGSGRVRVQSRIFLGDGRWEPLHRDRKTCRATIQRHFDKSSSARIVIETTEKLAVTLGPASFTPEYGLEEPTQVITLEGHCDLPARWSLVCCFSN